MKKIIKLILLIVCLIVFIFSGYKIFNNIKEENANKKINNELVEKAVSSTSNDTKNEKGTKKSLPITVDFSILKQENQDIVGWIYSENTPINYPILQSHDNEYYLRKLINGEYNTAGSIFMDYRNDSNMTDDNTIIYGHNMKNDTMFGTLPKYKDQKYYENNSTMYLFTQDKNYIIKLFAGCTISVDSDIYNLSELNKDELVNKSDFKSNVIIEDEDRIITLSTCSYDYDGARYIVMGKLEEIID